MSSHRLFATAGVVNATASFCKASKHLVLVTLFKLLGEERTV
jgi:hypothetical protein